MSWFYWVAAITAVLVFIYLVIVLLAPEYFS